MTEILWDKVAENAAAARLLVAAELYNVACAQAYYAMFTAARALLEEQFNVKPEATKRHSTVIRLFSLECIRSGSMSEDLGREFRRASRLRGVADYMEASVDIAEVTELLATMERFIARAAELRHSGKPR